MPYGPMPTNIDSLLQSMEKEAIIKSFEANNGGGVSPTIFYVFKRTKFK